MPEDMPFPHITLNGRGVSCIDGTRHRVIDIVADHMAHGYSAAQIVEQYPDLTPAQVHATLTYYYDHIITIIKTRWTPPSSRAMRRRSTSGTTTRRIPHLSQRARQAG
jgi:uncharacterized protein (DUF433 family)